MLSIDEIHRIQLQNLKELHAFCDKNNLRYVLAYGTLLGAVRDKGFIPWDNDVDIYMPRYDLMKMIEISKENNYQISEHLELKYFKNDKHYRYDVLRLCDKSTLVDLDYLREKPKKMGLWIDVFALDGVYKCPFIRVFSNARFKSLALLTAIDLYFIPTQIEGWKEVIKLFILKMFIINSRKKPCQRLSEFSEKIDYDASDDVASYVIDTLKEKPKITRKDIDNAILIQFEDTELYIPMNAEHYLESVYGNWRQLPPLKERKGHPIDVKYNTKN